MKIIKWVDQKVPFSEGSMLRFAIDPEFHKLCEEYGQGTFDDYLTFPDNPKSEPGWNDVNPVGRTGWGGHLYFFKGVWCLVSPELKVTEFKSGIEGVLEYAAARLDPVSKVLFFRPKGIRSSILRFDRKKLSSLQSYLLQRFSSSFYGDCVSHYFDRRIGLLVKLEHPVDHIHGSDYLPTITIFYSMDVTDKAPTLRLVKRLEELGAQRDKYGF